MANVYAVKTGNWSDTTVWNTGTLPTASDVVRPNTYSVYINQNINVTTLVNNAAAPAVAGGSFYLLDGLAITASISGGLANTNTLVISQSNSAIILGNVGNVPVNQSTVIYTADSANLIVTGSFNLANNVTTGINHTSAGILRVTGSIVNISGSGTTGIINSSSGSVYLIGNLSSGTTTVATTGGGIRNASIGNVYITGSVTGGTSTSTIGAINNVSTGNVYVSGSVTAGASVNAPISSTTNGTIIVRGPISASITANGVSSTGTVATNIFTGPFYNTGSFAAVYAYNMQMYSGSTTWTVDLDNATQKTLVTANQLAGYPAISNVRQGISYGPGNEFTGSLAIPNPATVKQGVATDNTTGSAILTASDMFDIATQTLTTSGSIGEILKNAATVQTTAATLTSYKV